MGKNSTWQVANIEKYLFWHRRDLHARRRRDKDYWDRIISKLSKISIPNFNKMNWRLECTLTRITNYHCQSILEVCFWKRKKFNGEILRLAPLQIFRAHSLSKLSKISIPNFDRTNWRLEWRLLLYIKEQQRTT